MTGKTPLQGIFFFTLVLFFSPAYFSSSIDVAFFSYAIAHGLQYLSFVGVISLSLSADDVTRVTRYRRAAVLFLFVLVGGFIFIRTASPALGNVAAADTIARHALDFAAGAGSA